LYADVLIAHIGGYDHHQSGTAVSKNADAIKKAQAAIALDLEGDDDEDDDENAKEDEVAEVRSPFVASSIILLRTNRITLQAIKLVEEGKKQAAEANAEQPVDPELQKLASLIPGVSAAVGSTPNKKEKSKKR